MGKDDLKSAAKEFFIDTYLEFNRGEIIAKLRMLLGPLSPDELKRFIAEGKAPPVPDAVIGTLRGYEDYIEKINPEELFQWIAEARPDLAEVLISLGDEGAEYVVKLRGFIVAAVKNPQEAPQKQKETQMVKLKCDACGTEWTLPKELAQKVSVCPFCGKGAEEEGEPGSQEELDS